MTRYGMSIDIERCIGCQACMVACKTENQVPLGYYRLRMRTTVVGTFPNLQGEFRLEQCFHCENAPCVPVCPTGATYRTREGLVLVDSARCIGCKACVTACPYELSAWGWQIALYLFLGGLVAGLMILGGIFRLSRSPRFERSARIGDLVAPPLLGIGMLLLLLDLSAMGNVWRLYVTFQLASPMSWGSWILLLTMPLLAVRFVASLGRIGPIGPIGPMGPVAWEPVWAERARRLVEGVALGVDRYDRALASAGVLMGLGVGFYTGVLLSSIQARPLWDSAALAPLFLVSGLSTGAAFLCLFMREAEHSRLVPFSVGLCAVELSLILAYALSIFLGSEAARRAAPVLFGGGLGLLFWGMVVFGGLLLPAGVEAAGVLGRHVPVVPARVPPILKLAGGVTLRFVVVYAGMRCFVWSALRGARPSVGAAPYGRPGAGGRRQRPAPTRTQAGIKGARWRAHTREGSPREEKGPMIARKLLTGMLPVLVALAMLSVGCAAAAAPAPTAAPTVAPNPTVVPQPTAAPRPAAAAALDLKAVLDKYFSGLPDGFGTVAPAALNDQLSAAKPFLVDLREAKEVADNGFIAGSVNISIRALAKNLDKLPARDAPIIVTCGSGHRSALGMMALQLLGYSNVKSLAGGFGAWKSANLPVATGAPPAPVAGKVAEVDKELLEALDKYLSGLPDGFSTISAQNLKDQLEAAKPFHVDVREPKEIADNGYIAGAVQVPVRGLIKNLDKLPQDKAAVVIAECGSGHRSALAMMGLNLLGYTNVKSLAGGFGAWKTANLPITK